MTRESYLTGFAIFTLEPSTLLTQIRLCMRSHSSGTQVVLSLEHIFAKYCTPPPSNKADAIDAGTVLLQPPEGAVLTDEALDEWALDTNGALLSDGEKAELEMLDVDDDGRLTYVHVTARVLRWYILWEMLIVRYRCKGFIQLYQLQSENDDEETWKDLVSLIVVLAVSTNRFVTC